MFNLHQPNISYENRASRILLGQVASVTAVRLAICTRSRTSKLNGKVKSSVVIGKILVSLAICVFVLYFAFVLGC